MTAGRAGSPVRVEDRRVRIDRPATASTLDSTHIPWALLAQPTLAVQGSARKGQSGIEEAVFRQIEAAGAMERTLVVSDNRGTISRFRRVSRGKVATASSTVELLVYWILHVLHLGALYDPPFQALQPPEKYKDVVPVVTRRFVRKAHDRRIRVDVWTIDDEPAMRRLLSYGVDGIMTDRPDVLARFLNSR